MRVRGPFWHAPGVAAVLAGSFVLLRYPRNVQLDSPFPMRRQAFSATRGRWGKNPRELGYANPRPSQPLPPTCGYEFRGSLLGELITERRIHALVALARAPLQPAQSVIRAQRDRRQGSSQRVTAGSARELVSLVDQLLSPLE